jgi:cytochrome c-type biogenesis protein CcmH
MRIVLMAALLLFAVPRLAAVGVVAQAAGATQVRQAPQIIEETELDRQTRAVAAQLRCVVCQGLSVEDSPSQLAQEMRALVREQLEMGRTPAEVKQFFVEKYGEWVLLQPEPVGFNLLVYVLPVVMLFGGAAFVFFTARGMVRKPGAGADAVELAGGETARDEVEVQ